MDDEKMQDEKPNKSIRPSANKAVRIRMRPNRTAEGVLVEKDGTASVDAKTAEWLVKIGYADIVA